MLDGAAGWLCSLCARRLRVASLAAVFVLLCGGAVASASLPDARAWEMVSPLEKNGGEVNGIAHGGEVRGVEGDNGGGVVQASPDGQGITYVSKAAFGDPRGAPTGSQYVATRKEAGWQTQNITIPANNQTYRVGGVGIPYLAFSSDLSSGLVFGGIRSGHGAHPVENPPLAPNAPAGYENYYLDGILSGALQPLLTHTPSVPPEAFELEFFGATPDLNHLVLRSPAVLGAGAVETGNPNLYEWDRATGQFQPVNVLPNGTPLSENVMLLGSGGGGPAISEDGTRIVWTGGSNLYVREGIGSPQAVTVQLDASRGGPDPGGNGKFRTASSDGSKIFFTDKQELTSDANTGSPATCGALEGHCGNDLYEFDVNSGQLRDITVDHVDPRGAEVQGVLGASEDGSYLYFVANGVLASGATRGNCVFPQNTPGTTCNLYLWHEGWKEPRFIAALSSNDGNSSDTNSLGRAFDWASKVGERTARVSRDGRSLVFMSERSLTGYDNTVSTGSSCGKFANGEPLPTTLCEEVFLYEATPDELSPGHLSCVSCNPTGARPSGPSGIPGGTEFANNHALYQSRVLSEGTTGNRMFFDSTDALVPQDTNGTEDVYEYENGHIYLLSDGKSTNGASFVDASVNGNDAFIVTRAQLAAQDTDQLVDLYDVRAPHTPGENIGFPTPPNNTCEGEACRPTNNTPPVFTAPSSTTFTDPGTTTPTPITKYKPTKKKKKKATKRRTRARRGKRARTGTANKNVNGRR